MVPPVDMGMLGAERSGTEESVENWLSERRLAGVSARAQVGSRHSTMPAPGPGTVRGSVTENLYLSGR